MARRLGPFLAAILFVIAAVGFCVLLYMINLRMDAVLYARTINAIRKHFYDLLPMDINRRLRTRMLPQSPSQPQYAEYRYFLPVVLAFAFFDTFYLFWGLTLLGGVGIPEFALHSIPSWSWLAFIFVPVHYIAYVLYARYREHSYLSSYAIGVDIDGVLNVHRQHFCTLLRDNVGVQVDPEEITIIPLRDCPALKVSRDDEKQVFNDPRYWTDMKPLEHAARNLDRLRNMNFKISIFSHRAWPDTFGMEKDAKRAINQQWRSRTLDLIDRAYCRQPIPKLWRRARLKLKMKTNDIEQITECWLRSYGFVWNSLTIERGNEHVADPQGHFRNRFYIARKKRFKFFVEDDLDKAVKLAYLCDVVFLMRHPYNGNTFERCSVCERDCTQDRRDVPGNVMTVQSWDDIYKAVRRLS